MTFEVVNGGRQRGAFVCTWCGDTFPDRDHLEAHWDIAPSCSNNRNVNNPTQEKTMVFSPELVTGAGWTPEDPEC